MNAIVWSIAPIVADAYERAVIEALFRVVGLTLVVRPLYAVHEALLRRELRFAERLRVRIVANLVELAVKLGTAAGGGLWAFVFGPLARELASAIGTPWRARWRPRAVFRPRALAAEAPS